MCKLEEELNAKKELLAKIDTALRMQGRSVDELLKKAGIDQINTESKADTNDVRGNADPVEGNQEPQGEPINSNVLAPPVETEEIDNSKQETQNISPNTVEEEPAASQDADKHEAPAAETADQTSASNEDSAPVGDTGDAARTDGDEAVVAEAAEPALADSTEPVVAEAAESVLADSAQASLPEGAESALADSSEATEKGMPEAPPPETESPRGQKEDETSNEDEESA
ncbi:hypothetical protein EPH_0063780 [Eimeria praecox]|uniref:Uncharacterized protein n=1 Tax=Eimeria praecox TaxID=51316 RepID=U6H421_9EIME|nr:hypothetical protein EPH_0063780 [Eimeria praecox]